MQNFIELLNWVIALLFANVVYRFSHNWVFRKHWGRFNPQRAYVLVSCILVMAIVLATGLPKASYLFLFFSLCAFGAGAIKKRSIFM